LLSILFVFEPTGTHECQLTNAVYSVAIINADSAAASLKATPMQLALAWLLQRSANILLIPGTSSLSHLRENLAVVQLKLSAEIVEQLDAIATSRGSKEATAV
jgi:aryl-alcohol dehydrogenase-like predicted oxidoreductase